MIAHVLLLTAPEPLRFFAWIVGLATAGGRAPPFLGGGSLESQIATAAINLAIEITILSIVGRVARTSFSTRRRPRARRSL